MKVRQDQVVVVGAGLAGLVAANTLLDAGVPVAVLDGHPPGGRARTTPRNGWLLNTGPHALFDAQLAAALAGWGIRPTGGQPADGGGLRFSRAGELFPIPTTAGAVLSSKLFGLRSKIAFGKLFAALGKLDVAALQGRSLTEWLDAPDDVTAVVRTLIRTNCYVDAPDQLDAAAALGQLRLSLRPLRYVDGGWATIVDALRARLVAAGVEVERAEVVAVRSDGSDLAVDTTAGPRPASAVIVAAGGPATEARLLDTSPEQVGPPVEVCALDVLLDAVAAPPATFALDEPLYASPHGRVARVAPDGKDLLCLQRYLAPGEQPGEPAAERARQRDYARRIGLDLDAVVDERYLHRVTVAHSFPQAQRGGLAGRPGVATSIPGVFRAGDWVGPEGLLADASAASAISAARLAAGRTAGGGGRAPVSSVAGRSSGAADVAVGRSAGRGRASGSSVEGLSSDAGDLGAGRTAAGGRASGSSVEGLSSGAGGAMTGRT